MPIPLDANRPIFEKTQLFICCTRALKYGAFDLPFKIRIPGATGYDLALVARGACVGSIDMTVHVWDVAALWPIIEEAGGCAIVNRSEGLFPLRDHVDYSEESYSSHCKLLRASLEIFGATPQRPFCCFTVKHL